MRRGSGYTLIELIALIIVISIVVAIAMPKYLEIKEQASKSVAQGITAALWGAIQMKHAMYLLKQSDYTIKNVVEGVSVSNVTIGYTGDVIWADVLDKRYTWSYTARTDNEMARIKPFF